MNLNIIAAEVGQCLCSGIFVLDSSKNNSLRGLDRYDQ